MEMQADQAHQRRAGELNLERLSLPDADGRQLAHDVCVGELLSLIFAVFDVDGS
jgi:hypothetical protein